MNINHFKFLPSLLCQCIMMCYIDIIPFLISELVEMESVKSQTVKEREKGRKIAARMIRAG